LHHPSKRAQFEHTVLPHLDAAYNLARWLLRNDADADDVTQEACVRAYRFFDSFHGGNAKTWLLTIVRHACYTWLKQHRAEKSTMPFDEQQHSSNNSDPVDGHDPFSANPEALFLQDADRRLLHRCLEELPLEFRETLILRELEGLSYKEISTVMEVPIGTVMSRLARGRALLQQQFAANNVQEA
jgi:RNA polymerase sigma-70 factor (ECF subfamily)